MVCIGYHFITNIFCCELFEKLNTELLLLVAVRDSLNWLKHNKDPREDVNFHWKITSRARYNDFVRNEPSTMNTYFQTYNVLKQSWGHTLINIDFEELYNKKSTDLFVEWTPFFERFYKTAVDRNLKKAKELVNLLNEDIPECE